MVQVHFQVNLGSGASIHAGTMVVVILLGQKLKQKTRERLQMKISGTYMYSVAIRTGWPDLLISLQYPEMESSASFSNLKSLVAKTEKAMAPHSSTLAWKIPWMEEPGGLQSMGSLRVGHD